MIRAVGLFLLGGAAVAFAQTPCERLKALSLPNVTITAAARPPMVFGRPQVSLPARCDVRAVLTPTPDSHIEMALWLPVENWNGKFMAVGNGGWGGDITFQSNPVGGSLASGLLDGYAVASTDRGHKGGDPEFAFDHPEKVVDFGYRAVHEMTVASKAMISAFYGQSPKFSYWNGCSAGGQEGLMEAQRYPQDFDGIIAGAPANNWTHLFSGHIWNAQAIFKYSPGYMPPEKTALLHEAVMQACDALDGAKDGVLENPSRCNFDPQALDCKGPDGPDCLTSAQVEGARKIYGGVVDPQTNQQIFPGLARGSELEWDTSGPGARDIDFAEGYFQFVVYQNPKWNYRQMDFNKDVAASDHADKGIINAMNPDLQPFFDHGGKLLQYHGWSDAGISPFDSVHYYNSVAEKLGSGRIDNSYRLFLVPGMSHCGNGIQGPNLFNPMSALEHWRESSIAPSQLTSMHVTNGVVDTTHPVCPYPQVAVYNGTGSTNDAANFSCKAQPGF